MAISKVPGLTLTTPSNSISDNSKQVKLEPFQLHSLNHLPVNANTDNPPSASSMQVMKKFLTTPHSEESVIILNYIT